MVFVLLPDQEMAMLNVLVGLWAMLVLIQAEPRRLLSKQFADLQRNCGYNSKVAVNDDYKSLYGSPTKAGTAPWAAAIVGWNNGDPFELGTGTLVSPRHILTVGHATGTEANCTTKKKRYPWKVSDFRIALNVTCQTRELCDAANRKDTLTYRKVKRIFIRKEYMGVDCPNDYNYDIAIYELETDVHFSRFIYPACTPTKAGRPQLGTPAFLFGFGDDPAEKKLPGSGILKHFPTKVVKCNWPGNMFCTLNKKGTLACAGDSGSGLIFYPTDKTRKAEVIGTLVTGDDCNDVFNEHNKFRRRYNSEGAINDDFKSLYGTPTDPGTAPWAAAIVPWNDGSPKGMGSGTLISPRHVLTAAHVVGLDVNCTTGRYDYWFDVTDYRIVLNATCVTDVQCHFANRTDVQIYRKVKRVFFHKGYVGGSCQIPPMHDIAIFELETDVPFSPFIYPACTPTNAVRPQPGTEARLFGYGNDPSEKILPNSEILKEFSTQVVECPLVEDRFCTMNTRGILACAGDSGSGLISYQNLADTRNTSEVIGILSAGKNCVNVHREHKQQKCRNKALSNNYDYLISVAMCLDFLCDSSGICPGGRSPETTTYHVLE